MFSQKRLVNNTATGPLYNFLEDDNQFENK